MYGPRQLSRKAGMEKEELWVGTGIGGETKLAPLYAIDVFYFLPLPLK